MSDPNTSTYRIVKTMYIHGVAMNQSDRICILMSSSGLNTDALYIQQNISLMP